jgi:hypothetical protein
VSMPLVRFVRKGIKLMDRSFSKNVDVDQSITNRLPWNRHFRPVTPGYVRTSIFRGRTAASRGTWIVSTPLR